MKFLGWIFDTRPMEKLLGGIVVEVDESAKWYWAFLCEERPSNMTGWAIGRFFCAKEFTGNYLFFFFFFKNKIEFLQVSEWPGKESLKEKFPERKIKETECHETWETANEKEMRERIHGNFYLSGVMRS